MPIISLLPPENCAPKNDKNAPKLLKEMREDYVVFSLAHFRIYSLKIFEGGGLGHGPL